MWGCALQPLATYTKIFDQILASVTKREESTWVVETGRPNPSAAIIHTIGVRKRPPSRWRIAPEHKSRGVWRTMADSPLGTSHQMELDCRRLTKSRYANAVEEYPFCAPLRVNSPVIGFIC